MVPPPWRSIPIPLTFVAPHRVAMVQSGMSNHISGPRKKTGVFSRGIGLYSMARMAMENPSFIDYFPLMMILI